MAGHKTRIPKKKLLEAIKGSSGIIGTIAKKLDCSWHTAQNAIFTIPEAKQAYEDEVSLVLDIAENTILDAIFHGKDLKTAKWYLMNKGRNRGYGDQIENQDLNTEDTDHTFSIVDESPLRACDTGEFDDE